MILDIFLSLMVLPTLWNAQFNFDGFLNLNNQALSQEISGPARIFTDYLDIRITAKSAMAVDAQSGKILYKKNEAEVLPLASITKLMTALVFLDYNPGWQTEWSVVPSDRRNGGIDYLNTGEILSLDNLFKTTLIVSDNDAAVALARSTGLAEGAFVGQMNIKAKELGLTNTRFADPTGLNWSNQSTVGDVVKLLNYAMQNEVIAKTTSTSYYEFETKSQEKTRTVKLKNTDALLNSYLNVLGGKTGTMDASVCSLAVKIRGEADHDIIVAVLNSQSNSDRFQDVKAITDWVLNNYKWN
jgi:serine-type D-Ala-D-Ala endopeptidase (penicillin-binding protein 7)